MELPHLGQHCSEPTCRQLDFLPFTCNLCKKVFCVDHHKYDAHSCTESYKADVQVPICPLCNQPVPSKRGETPDLAVNDHMENNCKNKNKKIYTNKCSAAGCKVKEMVPVSCESCHQNYCLRHRHTVDHDCKGPATAQDRAAIAAAARSSNKGKHQGNGAISHIQKASQAANQSIRKYLTPASGGPRPTGNTPSPRSASMSSYQGGMSEDEALARAMAASMQESNGSVNHQVSHASNQDEDALLAQAIAASLEQNNVRHSNRQQSNSSTNSCNVC
ncbi:zinc finger, AN1-type domain [Halocaridina rubra]|uniref:Zinc finger, AN1-type domain n=1 Tax=Halocaridina rubra TaxID=373956 RepID=A0AAN8ZW12_HALRR